MVLYLLSSRAAGAAREKVVGQRVVKKVNQAVGVVVPRRHCWFGQGKKNVADVSSEHDNLYRP